MPFYRPQHLHPYQSAKRPYEKPVPAKAATGVGIKALDTRFGRQARILSFGIKREISNRLGISRGVKLLKARSIDLFQTAADRPKAANQTKNQFPVHCFAKGLKHRTSQ